MREGARDDVTLHLPPGQQAIDGFPRFGTHFQHPPPPVPPYATIEISGTTTGRVTLPVADLATLPRRRITADFHCVAGWTATGLEWEGVAFSTLFDAVIAPTLLSDASVSHVVFTGLDGYRSIVLLEDAMADDVLIADRLDHRPLDGDHGAPVRLVSPSQYGFVSTKHLCAISVRSRAPRLRYHSSPLVDLRLQLVKPHARARVWHEERHRYLPARLVRPIYRALIPPFTALSARGGDAP